MDVRDFMLEQEAIRWHWKVKQGQSNKKLIRKDLFLWPLLLVLLISAGRFTICPLLNSTRDKHFSSSVTAEQMCKIYITVTSKAVKRDVPSPP